jgi:hypothetical protein
MFPAADLVDDGVGIGGADEWFGVSLVSRRKRLMAAWRSAMPVKAPRLRRPRVNLAKKPATALSEEAAVG